jgi:uncharacterized protein
MSDFERNIATSPSSRTIGGAVAVDQGLRTYMLGIYNYMVIGLAITGLAALGIYMLSVTDDPAAAFKVLRNGAQIPVPIGKTMFMTAIGYYVFVSPLKWVIMLSPLALVFVLSFGIERLRPAAGQMLFWLFAALMGLSLGSIFLVFTQQSIVRVFFITAATFGALSLYGYTTQRDLTGMGSFLFMGLFGVILAGLVNAFLHAPVLQFVISIVGVLIFTGLTAYDTQRLKNEYIYAAMDGDAAERASILGALSLYLNFINLFALLLQLMGQRDE